MKNVKYIILAVVAVILVAIAIIYMSLGNIVTKVVNVYGSQVTGTNVSLKGFDLSLSSGQGIATGFAVKNPKGYSGNAISFDKVLVKVDLSSLKTDTIVIPLIQIDTPYINYEMHSITQNNINQLLNNISQNTVKADEKEKADSVAKKDSAGKKVLIKEVVVNAGTISVTTIAGDAEVVLPQMSFSDFGNNNGGMSVVSSISNILNRILSVAAQTVVTSNVINLKDAATEGLKSVTGSVADTVKNIGIFGK